MTTTDSTTTTDAASAASPTAPAGGIDLAALLARIEEDRGVVHPNLAIASRFSPSALEQFHTSYMWAVHGNETLDRKTKELIMLAADATVYFEYGLKFHMGEALRYGATVAEIVAALELVGLVGGFHVPMQAFPLLEQVLDTEEFAHLKPGGGAETEA